MVNSKWLNDNGLGKLLKWLLLIEIAAFPCLAVSSWVASIYSDHARNLLSANGLRWLSVSIVSNFQRLPIAETLLVLIALSVFCFSGLPQSLTHHSTLKQRRALMFTIAVLLMIVSLICGLTFFPPYILLNFFGGIDHSPLTESLPGFFFLTIEILSCVYGFTSGKMLTISDFSQAHSLFIVKFAPVFIHLFLISQLIEWVKFAFFL